MNVENLNHPLLIIPFLLEDIVAAFDKQNQGKVLAMMALQWKLIYIGGSLECLPVLHFCLTRLVSILMFHAFI
jgi:hypothetical protein